MKTKRILALLLLSTLNPQLSTVFAQGTLNPPGSPAPTMKSLDQMEPRTPISSLPLTISQPGSYYVTTNLTCTSCTVSGGAGIFISTDDVTIDLRGFTIAGVSAAATFGISGPIHNNISVRNGTLKNWGGSCVNFSGGRNARVERVLAYNNGGGISVGSASQVIGCISGANTAGSGIVTGTSSLVQDCVTFQNSQNGIFAAANCAVISCVASNNSQVAIGVGDGSVVKDCSVSGNAGGIAAGSRCLVSGCTSANNAGSGISAVGDSLILGNLCVSNAPTGPLGAGIFASFQGNRIEGNSVNGNSRGIQLNGTGNLIIRNSAHANGTNYLFAGAQTFGPTNNFSDSTGVITNLNPWANFSY